MPISGEISPSAKAAFTGASTDAALIGLIPVAVDWAVVKDKLNPAVSRLVCFKNFLRDGKSLVVILCITNKIGVVCG